MGVVALLDPACAPRDLRTSGRMLEYAVGTGFRADYIGRYTKEPITESEYRKLAARRRSRTRKPRGGAGYEVYLRLDAAPSS